MMAHDVQQFLKDYLSLPPDSPTTVTYEPTPPPPAHSWLGGTLGVRWRANGRGAKRETIQFLKQRTRPRLQLHLVTFENTDGQQWNMMCHIAQDELGFWHMLAVTGSPGPDVRRASPLYPWVRIVGANGQHGIWAGGYLTEKASTAQIVRLTSKDGQVIEDKVEQGLVLFLTDDPVEGPFRLEAYTDTGELLGVQVIFDYEAYQRAGDSASSHT